MKSLNILLVEDDKMLSAVSGMFIQSLGHVIVAKLQSGLDAIAFCKKSPPDLILMDIHLIENPDGIETAKLINAFANIPVIFLSSDNNSETLLRSQIKNSYGFLVKPVDKRTLDEGIQLAYKSFSMHK